LQRTAGTTLESEGETVKGKPHAYKGIAGVGAAPSGAKSDAFLDLVKAP
jgi:hypothetical protein